MKLPRMFWVGAACGLSIMLLIAASGSGTINTIAKWTGATALGDSTITDDGFGNITIGAAGAGSIAIQPPDNPSSFGTDVYIQSGWPLGTNGRGGDLLLGTANGNGTSRGGNIRLGVGDSSDDAPNTIDLVNLNEGGTITLTANAGSLLLDAPKVLVTGDVAVEGGISTLRTITFSTGDSAPANALVPVAWKAVLIGTNEYRVPLYQ